MESGVPVSQPDSRLRGEAKVFVISQAVQEDVIRDEQQVDTDENEDEEPIETQVKEVYVSEEVIQTDEPSEGEAVEDQEN